MRAVINMNGDERSTLVLELVQVQMAATELRDRLAAMTINGRNYPQGLDAYDADREDRRQMVKKVEEVMAWATEGALKLMGDENA